VKQVEDSCDCEQFCIQMHKNGNNGHLEVFSVYFLMVSP